MAFTHNRCAASKGVLCGWYSLGQVVLQLGLMKEVLPCRHFQAGPALPEQAALDISCAFNYSELTVVQLVPLDALPTLGSGEDDWDPAAQALPADITEQLSQTVSPPSDQKSPSTKRPPAHTSLRGCPESSPGKTFRDMVMNKMRVQH